MSNAALAQAHEKLQRLLPASDLPSGESMASLIAKRLATRENLFRWFASLSDRELELLIFDLDFWARAEQMPPEVFELCIILAGRGFGKTWSGARWVIGKAKQAKQLGALVAPTAADVRDTMVEGPSGILALSPPWFRPVYEPSKCRITWPNGIYAKCFSADKPDSLRGPNTGWVWGDEPATWRYEMAAFDQIKMFNRIGTEADPPQTLLTGTPQAGLKKLAELVRKKTTVLLTGSSFANSANLAPSTVREMRAIANTRWGQQEVGGLLLMDVPGAIFGKARWRRVEADPLLYAKVLERRIISVDPAPTSDSGADDWGIVALGARTIGELVHISVLGDLSKRYSPREAAGEILKAYVAFDCEALVVEVNTGGEMVETLIRMVAAEMGLADRLNVLSVRAKEQKSKRAEPVAALAESERIEFVGPLRKDSATDALVQYPKLERQLEQFTGINGRRDDRADAMCWGVHHLAFGQSIWAFS